MKETKVEVELAVVVSELKGIKNDIKELKDALSHKYVLWESFRPVQQLVYGLVGIVFISILGIAIKVVFT
jgi:hypothetical protein